jgi:hypothetical protein
VDLTDAIYLANAVILGGRRPPCADAMDFDDDGIAELTDAILVLTFLFREVDLSAPPGPYTCGPDPTTDGLEICRDPSCP